MLYEFFVLGIPKALIVCFFVFCKSFYPNRWWCLKANTAMYKSTFATVPSPSSLLYCNDFILYFKMFYAIYSYFAIFETYKTKQSKRSLQNIFHQYDMSNKSKVIWQKKKTHHICIQYIHMDLVSMCSVGQSCPTLCDPMNCSLPGFPVRGISQELVAIFFSKESSRPKDWTHISCISCIGRWILYHCTTYEAYIYVKGEMRGEVHITRNISVHSATNTSYQDGLIWQTKSLIWHNLSKNCVWSP